MQDLLCTQPTNRLSTYLENSLMEIFQEGLSKHYKDHGADSADRSRKETRKMVSYWSALD